ncbi:hypothetical protein Z043_115986 [Scleropages formosus]|nr:hypothetical protein Z043_115986 [Scleropages formosus]
MSSLEILSVNQCDDTNVDFKDEIERVEQDFYRGGKVSWISFWLSEKKYVGEFIERDVYKEISKLISDTPKWSMDQTPVNDIKIYHLPGSGGSTIARHVLWNNRKNFRCAVVKPSFSASAVAEHAVKLREYEETDVKNCLPVLLLVEDFEREFLGDLRKELEVAMRTKKVVQGTLCFTLLSCIQSRDPEKMRKESPFQSFAVTHKLSADEKRQFERKMTKLEKQYAPEYIITAVMMSKEFNRQYVEKFVKDLLEGINRSLVVTRLILYVALLNTYVQNSYLSQSHCEALLLLTMELTSENQETTAKNKKPSSENRFRRHFFESSLSVQAKVLFLHLRDEKTYIQSIRIINPVVAEAVLRQLLGGQQQGEVALHLLREKVLFQNNFGKDHYHKFLRNLCIRRNKIREGDKSDTLFSPLIEHVMEKETPEMAVEILEEAYRCFGEDAFFAQQLARLHYTNENFWDAKTWAEVAEKKLPNSFILDTKGQVFKRWFKAKRKLLGDGNLTPESTVDAIATALEAIDCFKTCQEAANSEQETMNNSGYFAEVEVECDLINLILKVFPTCSKGHAMCLQYLVEGYIPELVMKPWEKFHSKLKYLHKNLFGALERISEDLSYFQTDIDGGQDGFHSSEFKIRNPIRWLAAKTTWYGRLFSDVPVPSCSESQFSSRMKICALGGGNITNIFSLLSEKKEEKLAEIVQVYCDQKGNLDQIQVTNYIASQIALGCLSDTPNFNLQDLQKLSEKFPKDRSKCQPNALFLLTLLFWPEDNDNEHQKDLKYEIITSAVDYLKKSYTSKRKEVPQKEQRIFTHFFLGKGRGLKKIVHKSKMENLAQLPLSQKRMKWFSGDVWKTPEITALLRHVQGWTENGNIYIEGSKGKALKIHALNSNSVPDGNENVEFFLGFTFNGPVACGVTVSKTK